MKKTEVTFHSDGMGYGRGNPAVNVKLHSLWEDCRKVAPQVAEENGYDPADFSAWVERLIDSDGDAFNSAWEWASSDAYEHLQEDAEEIFPHMGVKLYSEGRMSGWLVAHNLPDIEEWDAIMLGKWAKFVRYVKGYLEVFPESLVSLLCINQYDRWREAEDKRLAVKSTRLDLEVLTA